MPSGFFLLPSPHERDLSSTRDAARELEIFMNRYPESEFGDEARELWRDAMTRMATHEYEIAKYYFDRDNPRATVNRLRYMLNHFSGLGFDAEALFLLGQAHLELEEHDRAQAVWRDLVNAHPNHPRASDANQHLSEL